MNKINKSHLTAKIINELSAIAFAPTVSEDFPGGVKVNHKLAAMKMLIGLLKDVENEDGDSEEEDGFSDDEQPP